MGKRRQGSEGADEELEQTELERHRRRQEQLEDLRRLSKQPEFRRYLHRLMEFTGVFRSSFTGNSTTFFNEGQRNVGLFIFQDMMAADPELYGRIVEEQREKSDG